VLIVRGATSVDAGLIEKAERLKLIGRAGIGVDNVDVETATGKGIIVMNSPRGNALAAAEHTVALIFALARKVTLSDRSMKQGRWEKSLFTGMEVSEKTLGIIGLGNVGRIVAEKARALGMKVIAYDPNVSAEKASEKGIEATGLDALLARSDFVTLHVPLREETRHLLNRDNLSKAKKGVFIINAARGGIIDPGALYDALEKGPVAGAALDVFETEPPAKGDRLVCSDKVIATPHIGGSTAEGQKKVATDIANQVVDYILNGVITNSVNTPPVSMETKEKIAPYTTLTERLARFVSLIYEGRIDEIEIEYRGAIAEVETTVLTREILSRIVGTRVKGVNAVNALIRTESMGIKTREFKEVLHYYPTSLLVIRLRGERGETAAYGTLLKKNEARLIRLNDISVDADLTGRMLLVYSYDRPGLIGRIAGRLAQVGINIGEMHFGREKAGGLALSLFDLDQMVDDETVEALRSLADITDVKRIDLGND
jgi:D-3-phosphoglycerate dehydrogenase